VVSGKPGSAFGPAAFFEFAHVQPQGRSRIIVRGFTHEWMLLETERCGKADLDLRIEAFLLALPGSLR
jgi:hypothetical protein